MVQKPQAWLRLTGLSCIVMLCMLGCRDDASTGIDINDAYRETNILCDNLYQGDSLEDAVLFMNAPDDRQAYCRTIIERYGSLATVEERKFANRIFHVGRTKSLADYHALLSDTMLALLRHNDNDTFLWCRRHAIQTGHFLYACCEEEDYYGPCEARFVVTCEEMTPENLPTKGPYWPQTPTHRFMFVHFHAPKYMIIGSPVYAVKDKDGFKIVCESMKNGAPRTEYMPERVAPVSLSGIEQCLRLENDPNTMQWKIAIADEVQKANTIDIVLASSLVSADPNAYPLPEKVLFDYELFRKYCEIWEDVRFELRACLPSDLTQTHVNSDKGQISFSCLLGSGSESSLHSFPSVRIITINIQETNTFEQGKLTLFTFDSTDEHTSYHNSVFVRLTPKQPVE